MDLPKNHWIHAAMAKEKERVGKKKLTGAGGKKPTKKPGKASMGNGQPMNDPANASSTGMGPSAEMQHGGGHDYTG